jgi:uncharacterized protein YaeQ
MALRSTIYKFDLHISDNERNYYNSHPLTIAQHPSETAERMMVRLLLFALYADERLSFTKGLSEIDEPDIWVKDLTGQIKLWLEVGQPDEKRILKACSKSDQVVVCAFSGQASNLWWSSIKNKVQKAKNLRVISVPQACAKTIGSWVQRTMQIHINIQEGEVLVSSEQGQINFSVEELRGESV